MAMLRYSLSGFSADAAADAVRSMDADDAYAATSKQQRSNSKHNAFAKHDYSDDDDEATYQPDAGMSDNDDDDQMEEGEDNDNDASPDEDDEDSTVDVGKYKLRRTSMRASGGGRQLYHPIY